MRLRHMAQIGGILGLTESLQTLFYQQLSLVR